MSLFEQISEDLKAAMLARDKNKLEPLRAIKTAFLLAKSEKGASDIMSAEDELKIIQKLVKQRKDSAEIYKSQNRTDLFEKEISEAEVIEQYLPKQLSEEELKIKLKEIIKKLGADSPKDMGKVMGAATKELTGQADGKAISALVKILLSGG
ncbi:MAG: GatB/YqeY domain-containing protein [Bacteroidales bacterium]|nr:GatB/YqeY domain-containing protein [Bacteroidales bacterium]